jgi:hypothetical protein
LGISLPSWILLLGATSSLPIGFALRILYVGMFRRRQAARMGARLAFPLEGKQFGNLDIMLKLVERFNNGYPGMAVYNFCTLILYELSYQAMHWQSSLQCSERALTSVSCSKTSYLPWNPATSRYAYSDVFFVEGMVLIPSIPRPS